MKMCTNFVISAVICELNPPHNGHISIIEQCKGKTGGFCIAVMSGNYVQRGQPAIFDKWTRAKTILRGGADLVMELPLPFAIGSAETFAMGGVSLLESLRCVDQLWFGSESGQIAPLQKIANALETGDFSRALHQRQQRHSGLPFAKVRQLAVADLLGEETAALLSEPNNILGVSYCQGLEHLSSKIQPQTVRRLGAGYHEESVPSETQYPSATQLRALLSKESPCDLSPYLPASCAEVLEEAIRNGLGPVLPEKLEPAILSKLRTLSLEELGQLPDISEGLEQRLYRAIRESSSLEEVYALVKTKRYSLARIRRLVLSAFLGVTKWDTATPPPYCRVLGMKKESTPLLSHIAKTAAIPVLTRMTERETLPPHGRRLLELEETSSDQYSLAYPLPQRCGMEFTRKFITE